MNSDLDLLLFFCIFRTYESVNSVQDPEKTQTPADAIQTQT